MKHLLALVLVALLLIGCTPISTESTTTEGTASESTTAPVTPPTNTDTTAPSQPTIPTCSGHDSDPYVDVDKEAFYANYTTACCYEDSQYRSQHYLMSGSLEVPGQYATVAEEQPMEGTAYIRNTDSYYLDDGNTYVVVDCYGEAVMYIYRGGAYITLEEVAAYMYAFGGTGTSFPANYTNQKLNNVGISPWGIYLRGNYSSFSGNTTKYPYEPKLPNISGCGGTLQYYEMDIGTTGTDTGNGYAVAPYNDGSKITRGAARIVYGRYDLNGDGEYSQDEVYVFYTCNHYNDFQEYLNYYGGWGEIFGNITGGGTLSSKTDYNPTAYVETAYASFEALFKKES